jgi:hypothetical protein
MLFRLELQGGELTLSDACQQRISLVDPEGSVVFRQADSSCL